MSGPGAGRPASVARRRQLTLLAMCISQGMILLDVTIVNIALPSIQRQLHMSPGRLEWVISAYALSLATLIPLGGTLGDRYGRKRVFLVGMVVFMAGTAACALSPSDLALIGARVVQGVGGAVMSALTLSILTETFPSDVRAAAIGTWAAVAGLGFGSGPVIGGLLLSVFGWSSVFWVNVPLAVAGLVLAVAVVTESRDPVARRLDVVGVVTSAAGLLGLTYGLIESSSLGWGSWGVVVPIVAGCALLVAFVVHEHRTADPMLPPRLLHAPSFVTGCSVYLLVYVGLAGAMYYATLLFQDVKGWSALETGLSWLAMNVPFLVVAQLSGRLNHRCRSATVVGVGCVAGGVGIVVLGLASASTPVVLAEAGYVLLGAGFGALVPGIANVAMRDVPPGVSGAASGILNTCRQVGTSVGLAVLGAVGVSVAVASWASRSASLAAGAHAAAQQGQRVAGGQIGAVTGALGAGARGPAVDAFVQGYHAALVVGGGCVVLAAVVTVVGLRGRRAEAPVPAAAAGAAADGPVALATEPAAPQG